MSHSTVAAADICTPSSVSFPQLLGADFIESQVNFVTNYSYDIPDGWRYSQPSENVQNATFCNVTMTYTHTGQSDTINVEAWLPIDNWNGRLQAIGGGGWVAGRFPLTYGGMAGAVFDGYATVTTDAGLGSSYFPLEWSISSPGNLNLVALQNLGLVSLYDEAIIAKHIIESFYGRKPSYSYWNACSQGGRQGAMLAQQFPDAYDGIMAAAPAVHWAEFYMSTVWPTFYMDLTGQYPRPCELQQLTKIAIKACDDIDGLRDGLISDPDACREQFDPFKSVGTKFVCSDTGSEMKLTKAAAAVANATWNGPEFSNGKPLWHGFEIGADLASLAPTKCTDDVCVATGQPGITVMYQAFIDKDLSSNVTKLTHPEFDSMYRSLKRVFASSMATDERDLSAFRNSGGKMITFHGLTDSSIPPRSSLAYYNEVSQFLTNTTDFYRYFRVPGLDHCWGGSGGQPESLFDQLRQWVENGTAPEKTSVTITRPDNSTQRQILCVYPGKAILDEACSRDSNSTGCWTCAL